MANSKKAIFGSGLIIAIILLAIGGYLLSSSRATSTENATQTDMESSAASIDTGETVEAVEIVQIDIDAALTPRIIGNPDAPIKISEYASLSCSHCANFHINILPAFKAEWIDTGKAYLVYDDFPLNPPALRATMVSRCIADDDQYFNFIGTLFDKQNDWAFKSNYAAQLKSIAKDYGVDNALFQSCFENQALQDGIVSAVRAAQQQFGVNSTPSFVINNTTTISGGRNYEEFKANLEAALNNTPE